MYFGDKLLLKSSVGHGVCAYTDKESFKLLSKIFYCHEDLSDEDLNGILLRDKDYAYLNIDGTKEVLNYLSLQYFSRKLQFYTIEKYLKDRLEVVKDNYEFSKDEASPEESLNYLVVDLEEFEMSFDELIEYNGNLLVIDIEQETYNLDDYTDKYYVFSKDKILSLANDGVI